MAKPLTLRVPRIAQGSAFLRYNTSSSLGYAATSRHIPWSFASKL